VTFTFNRVAGAKAYRRLWVPGYGHCYAADNWGIQRLTLTVESTGS
jgi:hypothetical protein